MAKIEIKGSVEKVVRQNGKSEAQVLITVPMSMITQVPLGKVNIILESEQGALFEKTVIRGDKRGQRSPVRGKETAGAAA